MMRLAAVHERPFAPVPLAVRVPGENSFASETSLAGEFDAVYESAKDGVEASKAADASAEVAIEHDLKFIIS